MYNLLIIGAGPAGLFCGINCATASMKDAAAGMQDATAGMKVCILEKNRSAGKKLLVSGSGRCNITNAAPIDEFIDKYGPAARFVKPALYHFTNQDLAGFFSAHGVPLVEMNDGKMFPGSQQSRDVLNTLLNEANRTGTEIHYNSTIQSVAYKNKIFHVVCSTQEYTAEKLLMATGGLSYPFTGSTGDGYHFAEALGHSITGTAPALVPVIVKEYRFRHCAGIAVSDAGIRIIRNNKTIRSSEGDILFTHRGLSGPGILDNSRYMQKNDTIAVRFSRNTDARAVEEGFISAAAGAGARLVKTHMTSLGIPDRLAATLMQISGIDSTATLAGLDRAARKKLSCAIDAFPFIIEETGTYSEAMATRGGISLSEVNAKTMESRVIPGMYFAGEVLDVDGDTGGFNLQFAFSSGKLAADSIISF